MTVKDAVKVLGTAKRFSIGFSDRALRFDQGDDLMLEIYGQYVIDRIYTDDGEEYELNVKMCPMKEQ